MNRTYRQRANMPATRHAAAVRQVAVETAHRWPGGITAENAAEVVAWQLARIKQLTKGD